MAKIAGVSVASAQDRQFRHALTLFDDIKYGPDFKNFDYVNPAAPKGGKVRLSVVGSFDSLNPYTFKGDSIGVAGNETLLASSLDEPSTEYGLIAESVWFPEDWSSVVYRLRPEARFHDGKPMTPEDVIWSMTTLKEINPAYNGYYKNVVKAEKTGEHEVTFHIFPERQPRIAFDNRPASGSSNALVDGQGCKWQAAGYQGIHHGSSARFRAIHGR